MSEVMVTKGTMVSTRDYSVGETFWVEDIEFVVTKIVDNLIYYEAL